MTRIGTCRSQTEYKYCCEYCCNLFSEHLLRLSVSSVYDYDHEHSEFVVCSLHVRSVAGADRPRDPADFCRFPLIPIILYSEVLMKAFSVGVVENLCKG